MLRKEKSVSFYKETEEFTAEVVKCVSFLRQTLHHYCDAKHDLAKQISKKVREQEIKADNLRRKIEKKLYGGVIIQMGTEDKYSLLEAIDDIADRAEILVRLAEVSKLKFPHNIVHDFREMANKTELSAKLLGEAISDLQVDVKLSIKKASKLEIIREQVRDSEFKILTKLFAKQGTIQTILLKDVITLAGQVADKIEEAADRVISMALKYEN